MYPSFFRANYPSLYSGLFRSIINLLFRTILGHSSKIRYHHVPIVQIELLLSQYLFDGSVYELMRQAVESPSEVGHAHAQYIGPEHEGIITLAQNHRSNKHRLQRCFTKAKAMKGICHGHAGT